MSHYVQILQNFLPPAAGLHLVTAFTTEGQCSSPGNSSARRCYLASDALTVWFQQPMLAVLNDNSADVIARQLVFAEIFPLRFQRDLAASYCTRALAATDCICHIPRHTESQGEGDREEDDGRGEEAGIDGKRGRAC